MKEINKKGFTLIEMLGAVAILGIIATIGMVSVSKVIASAHKKFDNTQYDSFMQAAETYFSDNKSRLPLTPMEWKEISLQELINKKYIEKLLDSNKQEFDYARSKVVVTRLTSGKYQYEAILYRKKGDPIGKISNKVTNQNSNITFKLRDKNKYHKENKTYYARDYPVIDIGIGDTDQLSGYQYIIYRNGKQFKKSENIEISGGLSVNEAVTLGKEFPFGKYSIKVVAYDKSGNKTTNSTDNSGLGADAFSIYIDRIKPNCAIQIDGTIGDNGWYKEKDISLTLKESDMESGILKHDMQTSKSFSSLGTLSSLAKLVKKQSDTGSTTWYAHVEDKAGNVCETEVNVKVDTKKPSCQVLENDGSTTISSNWYNMYTQSRINTIKLDYGDDGPSGMNRYILAQDKLNLSSTYKNYANNSSLATSEGEHTYNGYVRDYAGNNDNCSAFIRKDTIPPNCSVAGSGSFSLGPKAPEGWTQSVSYTITIKEDNIKKVDLDLTYNSSSGGTRCNNYSGQFSDLYRGSIVTGFVNQCYGFRGRVLADFTYYDQADNDTKCPQEQSKELKPTPRRGCMDPSANNYRDDAEEDDGSCFWQCTDSRYPRAYNYGVVYYTPSSCYWMCTDSRANNSWVPFYTPTECEYDDLPTPMCTDPDADNTGDEEECRYTCRDSSATNYGDSEKCEYAEKEPAKISCNDITISYKKYGSTKEFNGEDWTNDEVDVNVKIKSSAKDKIDHWDWWKNDTGRKKVPGSFDGCLDGTGDCPYTNDSSNKGNDTKTFKGEGVRKGVVVLYGKENQKPKKCPTEVYRIDKSPPEITAVCRFNNDNVGYSCTGADGAKHLYNGTFIRVEDEYVGIGPSEYMLRGNPSTRGGEATAKADRYCISAGGNHVDASHNLTYTICDILDNCANGKKIDMTNFGDFDGGSTSCDTLKKRHECKVIDKGNVKYRCRDGDATKCYNNQSIKVACP